MHVFLGKKIQEPWMIQLFMFFVVKEHESGVISRVWGQGQPVKPA